MGGELLRSQVLKCSSRGTSLPDFGAGLVGGTSRKRLRSTGSQCNVGMQCRGEIVSKRDKTSLAAMSLATVKP